MKRPQKNILIFIILFALFFSLAQIFSGEIKLAQASWLDKQTGFGSTGDIPKSFGQTGVPTDIRVITAMVVRVFLGFIGTIFVILIIMAGYKWMTARGNDDKVEEARDQLVRASIGLIIIVAAWGIAAFVATCVFEATADWMNQWYCF